MLLICSAIRFFASLYPNRLLTQTHAPSQQSISIRQTSFGTIFRHGKCCFGTIQHFCVTKQTAIVTTILQAEKPTAIYINIEKSPSQNVDGEFHVMIAHSLEEA